LNIIGIAVHRKLIKRISWVSDDSVAEVFGALRND